MTSTDGMQPFEPLIGAAVNVVEERLAEIRTEHESRPDDWQALRLRTFWNGDAALVLLKPERVAPTDLTIRANGEPQEWKGGRGVVAVLLRTTASHVVVDCGVTDALVQMTLPIRDF